MTTSTPAEVTELHTRILRLALGVEESRAYWAHADLGVSPERRMALAFEERWFGAKSAERCRTLVRYLSQRYDAFPEALGILKQWRSMEPAVRQVICHWHLQLADPLYRRFTGEFLPALREQPHLRIDRDAALRWMRAEYPGRWGEATNVQFASKLLSAAGEAGLLSRGARREFRAVRVPDLAIAYLLHLLRGIQYAGTLLSNPYLASVGLSGGGLDQRLRTLPGIEFRRMGELTELEWAAPSLSAWGERSL